MSVSPPNPVAQTARDQSAEILLGQGRVLQLIAAGGDLPTVLSEFCGALEKAFEGSRFAVMLANPADQTLAPVAAPNLPAPFSESLKGLSIGLAPGSSSAAVQRNELVVSADISTDLLWEGLHDEARAGGLQACWSAPIRSVRWAEGGETSDEVVVLGSLDCYFSHPAQPEEGQRSTLEMAAALASLAINTARTQEKIGNQQLYDVVTGLPNRRVFSQQLKNALTDVSPKIDKLAILLIDLDHFKEVNDTFGYSVGDFLLRSVAERLLAFRGTADILARFGDDEFALMLGSVESSEGVKTIAAEILEAVSEPYDFSGQQLQVSASVGGSLYPWDGEDGQMLLRNAENALYAAKKQGRNHYRLYAPTMGGYAFEKLQLKMALSYAIENNELELLFQPKVRSGDHKIIGAEALTYWNHPAMGRISPVKFIPLAEETGQIVALGEWVLKTACRQIKVWRETGYEDLTMAINISAIQFRERSFVNTVGSILDSAGLVPHAVELELTETVAMEEVEKNLERLQELHDLGVHISIDDFGTGYSSLAYLKRYPIHTLKIDKSFVLTTPQDKENTAIVKAVIALAHFLGLEVVAEGVETADQANYLRAEGCEILQGFHFSRPIPANEFGAILKAGFAAPGGP